MIFFVNNKSLIQFIYEFIVILEIIPITLVNLRISVVNHGQFKPLM